MVPLMRPEGRVRATTEEERGGLEADRVRDGDNYRRSSDLEMATVSTMGSERGGE